MSRREARKNVGTLLSTGRKPASRAWDVLNKHPRLLWFPLSGLVGTLLVAVGFFVLVFHPLTKAVGFVIYEMIGTHPYLSITAGFSVSVWVCFGSIAAALSVPNAALMACTKQLIDGKPLSIKAGWATAFRALPQLLVLASLTGAIGVVIAVIERRYSGLGSLVAFVVGASYVTLTFFVAPAAVLDGASTVSMFRESVSMIREHVGDVLALYFGIIPVVVGASTIPLIIAQVLAMLDMTIGTKSTPVFIEQHVVLVGGFVLVPLWFGLVLGTSLVAIAKTSTYVALEKDQSTAPLLDLEVDEMVMVVA